MIFLKKWVPSWKWKSLTLCDPMYCSLRGPSVHGLLQARILEWVAVPFFRGSFQPRDQIQVSCIAGGFQGYILNDWRRNLVGAAAKNFCFLKQLHFHYCSGINCAPPNSCSVGTELTCNGGDPAWIPGLGRSRGEGKG